MPITYGSVCSGIEAATVAWHPLGMRPEWFAEIEPFPSAVLAHHWPDVPNLGDMTALARKVLLKQIPAPEVLVGGTPCQAFSVAGMRNGLADPRGALTIKYVELADAVDHVRTARGDAECVVVWENVPGVLSDKGNAFGCFLGALVGESDALVPSGAKWTDAGCVYGPRRAAAWRVLDAQYFGLAQRRRRVFVVASARAGFDPCEVLFEREGVRRDTPPRRGEGQDLTGHAPFRPALQCGCGCTFGEGNGPWGCPNCEGDEGPAVSVIAGVPAFGGHSLDGEVSQSATLTAKDMRLDVESETFFVAPAAQAVAFVQNSRDEVRLMGGDGQIVGALTAEAGAKQQCYVAATLAGGGRKRGGYSADDIPMVAGTLLSSGKAAGSATVQDAAQGLLVVHGTQDPDILDDQAHPLGRNHGQENAVFAIQAGALRTNPLSGPDGVGVQADHAYTLEARAEVQAVQVASSVRRLTPVECERLQGFDDDHTLIPWRGKPAEECPDGPRYKAIGNSKAVYVIRWIGLRLKQQLERNP